MPKANPTLPPVCLPPRLGPLLREVALNYASGLFLMGEDQSEELAWYYNNHQTLMPLGQAMHVPRSLKRVINGQRFELRRSTATMEVVERCADRETTWINAPLKGLYAELAEAGILQSMEAWQEGKLAGGVFGLAIGAAFIGESMFTAVPEAGKVALVSLAHHLEARGFSLFDAQMMNPHLARFGAYEVPRAEYLALLAAAVATQVRF